MNTAKSLISRFIKGEEGVTLIEYGLLAALIAVACVTILGNLGTKLNNSFNNVNSKIP
ncbi:MAG TPA: Flp family type IVb pilin [Tepidisphaeraceae bacterium]|nr:Flp family type IVb pilin [Tepidisphaeraceae bacterium]